MTTEEKLFAIAQKLLSSTQAGKQNWEESVADATFITNMTKYSVTIEKIHGMNEQGSRVPGMILSLLNSEGKTLESLRAMQFDLGDDYDLMEELFVAARRVALDVDRAIDDVLSELE